MNRSPMTRLLTGVSTAALAATGIALGGPAHAVSTQGFLSYVDGRRVDQHVRELADVDGDRRDDIVGFGNAGVYVAYSRGDGSFTAPALKVREFGWNQGWRVGQHPRELADLNGNLTADIVGFGYSGVTISHGRTDRTFDGTGKRIDSFGWDRGWRVDKNPRLLADVDGNSTADIVGFGDAGTYVSYFSALGDTFTQPALEIRNFGYAQGWRVDQHPRDVGNVSGHLPPDVVGFGSAGVHVAYGDDNVFVGPALASTSFGWAAGWDPARYPRLLGDVNGDGRDDVVGFGYSATYVELS